MATLAELKGEEMDLILEIVCPNNKEEMDEAIDKYTEIGIKIERAERKLGIGVLFLCFCLMGCEKPSSPSVRVMEANVSAYCPCSKCCGKWSDGITASGKPAKGKLIAADKRFPFGTVMVIPGYGRAVVEDRGGAIKGNKIDLLFPDHQSALVWGRQYLKVEVIQ